MPMPVGHKGYFIPDLLALNSQTVPDPTLYESFSGPSRPVTRQPTPKEEGLMRPTGSVQRAKAASLA